MAQNPMGSIESHFSGFLEIHALIGRSCINYWTSSSLRFVG